MPADIPLDIIYEDDDILVINKKPDIAMHESHNHRCDALSNAVAFHLMKRGRSAYSALSADLIRERRA